MAWFKTGGGGALSETTLWTNSAPTSNYSGGTVDLSDSINNYQYIGMYCKFSTSDATEYFCFLKTSAFGFNGTIGAQFLSVTARRTNSQNMFRNLYRPDNTTDYQMGISNCSLLGTSGSYPGNLIPTKIVGLK